jgi:hypothetical protein
MRLTKISTMHSVLRVPSLRIDSDEAGRMNHETHGLECQGAAYQHARGSMKQRAPILMARMVRKRMLAREFHVCDRWLESFDNFLADMGERPTGKTLDRKNVDGNYEPGNCRWATGSEQQRNRRPRSEWKRRA